MKNHIFKSYGLLLCVMSAGLLLTLTGCGNKNADLKDSKKKFLSKKSKVKGSDSESRALAGFDLDDEAMKDFARSKKGSSFADQDLYDEAAAHSRGEFQTIFFDFNKYNVRKSEIKKLDADISYAQKMVAAGKTIVVEGHACHSEGSAAYNMVLSEKRAHAVAEKLTKAGIEKDAIRCVGRGQDMPIVHGGNREAQAPNRRVEIYAIANNA